MHTRRELALADQPTPSRIRPSRFVAGIALHFAVPAYLIWLALSLLPLLGAGDSNRLASAAGRASLQFLLGYAIFTLAISLAARAAEPIIHEVRERREARNPDAPARRSKALVNQALRRAATLGNGKALSDSIERLRSAPWRHEDQRFQTIASDLARAANAFAIALEGASPDGRSEVESLAHESFSRIAEAAEQLAEEQRRLDHGDARTIARYIELRYAPSRFH